MFWIPSAAGTITIHMYIQMAGTEYQGSLDNYDLLTCIVGSHTHTIIPCTYVRVYATLCEMCFLGSVVSVSNGSLLYINLKQTVDA